VLLKQQRYLIKAFPKEEIKVWLSVFMLSRSWSG